MLVLLVLILSGCQAEMERSAKPSVDWSRGLLLGRSNIKQPVALAVDGDEHVHLAWCYDALFYVHLDGQGRVLWNDQLSIDLPQPRKPQLLVDGKNVVHLAWLSRDQDRQILFHTRIDGQGQFALPEQLSADDENVSNFQMYLAPSGEIEFVLASTSTAEQPHIWYLPLTDPAQRMLLVDGGIDPSVRVDAHGTIHLAWLQPTAQTSRDVYYSILHLPDLTLSPQRLTRFEFGESAVYDGPTVGFDAEYVYVLWSVQNLGGGLTPTAAFSYYVAFEKEQAATVNARTLGVPPRADPNYEAYVGVFGYTKLDLLSQTEILYSSDFVNTPATVSGQQDELPVAVSLMTHSQSDSRIQIALGVFREGRQVGFQLANETRNASLMPSLIADADSNLHLAWLDTAGFSEFDIYYASNAPRVRRWLNRTTGQDVAFAIASLAWGVFSALSLLPIVLIWFLGGLVITVGHFTFTGYETMQSVGGKVGLGLGVVAYAVLKLIFLPGLHASTPFLRFVPQSLESIVGIAVPILILALGLFVAWLRLKRDPTLTTFRGYLTFALTDTLLTLVLYAPGMFGQG
ncbi:MAG: hypothetical protein JW934_23370 [Anaerolineae bacterium]|nr:hypothetical protein [Anaerolineae bacterium]